MWRRWRQGHWLLKVALLRQARPFNQVPHIRQLCPHSKQPLCLAGELQHPAGGGRGQLALGDQPKLPLPGHREVAFVCFVWETNRDWEITRDIEVGCREVEVEGRKNACVCVCLSPALMYVFFLLFFLNVYFVCLCDRSFAFSLLKCPAGRGEITGALKMVTEQ